MGKRQGRVTALGRLVRRLKDDEAFALALYDRFSRSFHIDELTGCWEWQRRLDSNGYGMLSLRLGRDHPEPVRAHVLAWVLYAGRFDRRLVRAHKCDNRRCCNPSHLEQKPVSGNCADAMERGRHSCYKNFKYMRELDREIFREKWFRQFGTDPGAAGADVPF